MDSKHIFIYMKAKALNKLTILLYVAAIAAIMSSCATTTYLDNGARFVTEIKEFGNYDVKNKTFYIVSGDEAISNNDLEFKEYASYYAENLKIKGAIETTDKDNADICILMNYCITDQSYQETIPIPQFGVTSVASTTTKGSRTTYQYNYGTTGYKYVQNNVSNYLRVVNIYAYDNKSRDSEPVMLWKTNFQSSGSSSDLRRVIPCMLFIEIDYFYNNNDHSIRTVSENDYLYNFWKQKKLSNPNIYFWNRSINPTTYYQENRKQENLKYIEKLNNETLLCFVKWGQKSYEFPSELYIVCNGKETKVDHADGYQLGTYIHDESGIRYFVLHFPVGLGDTESFEIREYTNKKHTKYNSWGTVQIWK